MELQLCGVKVHGFGTFGFFFYGGQGMSKKNIVCAAILYIINAYKAEKGFLPGTLAVQLDNCSGDNKNHTLFGFLSQLGALGIFHTIKVSQSKI